MQSQENVLRLENFVHSTETAVPTPALRSCCDVFREERTKRHGRTWKTSLNRHRQGTKFINVRRLVINVTRTRNVVLTPARSIGSAALLADRKRSTSKTTLFRC